MEEKDYMLKNREELITALRFASILEHTLSCEYLYTGFSMRRALNDFPEPKDEEEKQLFQAMIDQSRPWQTQIYFIARQEMEHLAIATNLLMSLGAKPYFKRPQFPVPRELTLLKAPFCLERLTVMALKTYVWFERPEYLTGTFPTDYLDRCKKEDGQKKMLTADPTPAEVLHEATKFGIDSVEKLYDAINVAFQTLPAEELFVGDTENQVGDIFDYKVTVMPITNRVQAAAAINLIIEQGEGVGLDPLNSDAHFQRFTQILAEVEEAYASAEGGTPEYALPVLMNPLVEKHKMEAAYKKLGAKLDHCYNCKPNLVTDGSTVDLMEYFNDCYNLMMVMLYDFFETYVTPTPPAATESGKQAAKFYGAFFPLMTMVIRPLGEILARIPAGSKYPGWNSGASFEIDDPLLDEWATLDEKQRLKQYDKRLKNLIRRAKTFAKPANAKKAVSNPDGDQVVMTADAFSHQMEYLSENITSTRIHFINIWQEKYGE